MASPNAAPRAEHSVRPRTGKPMLAGATVLAVPGAAVAALAIALAGATVEHAVRNKGHAHAPKTAQSLRGTPLPTASNSTTQTTATVAARSGAAKAPRHSKPAPARIHRHDSTPRIHHHEHGAPVVRVRARHETQTYGNFRMSPRSQQDTQGVPPSSYDGSGAQQYPNQQQPSQQSGSNEASGSNTSSGSGDWGGH